MSKPKLVLGFSGGLDTSYCVKYLTLEQGFEVHSVLVDTGGFSEDELKTTEAHAYALGVTSHTTISATETYYQRILKFLIFGNVLKNQTYPLSVSAERLIQALEMVKVAKSRGAQAVAHGSTGAGNDQVRFDLILNILYPEATVITPIRDLKLSREDEILYLKKHGVAMNFEKAAYSINKGLWGTSIGGRETLNSLGTLPESAWPTPITKTGSEQLKLKFEKGELIGLDGRDYLGPVQAIKALSERVSGYGIGRDIHVGDTIIGIKGRVGFEAAAPLIILKSHHLLEKHVLTKWQQNLKEQFAQFYGNWLHEGQILDPVMRNIEAFFESSQANVTGEVTVEIQARSFVLLGIESKHDLMKSKFGQYGEMNTGWSGEDVRGFSKIFGNQLKIYNAVNDQVLEK